MNGRRFDSRGLSALVRQGASRLGAAGLALAGSVLAVSLAVYAATAHTASPAKSQKPAAREHRQANPGPLLVALERTLGRPRGGNRDTGSSGAGWGSTSQAESTENQQGLSVSISGNIAVSSVPGANNNTGVAYIYDRYEHGGGQWDKKWALPDPRKAEGDYYSWSVAISSTTAGTYVAIGGNDNNGEPDFVYVYKASGNVWQQEAKIPDPGNNYLDMFGDALAISSTTLVVGASCENDYRGAAYIYQRSGTQWNRMASMSDPLGNSGDGYGYSVAVSGNTVLVGDLDVAYAYTRTPGQGWPQTAAIKNPGPSNDNFGQSVTLSGTTAVIGAPYAVQGEGAAYVFQLSGTTWTQRQELAEPGGGEFGWSVAMSGSELLIGEPIYGIPSCGTAYAFKLSGTKFAELGQMADPSCTAGAKFGFSVALTGTFGIIGAPDTNNDQGTNYIQPLP